MLRALISIALVALIAGQATSQDLDGVWFKVTAKSKGVTVENLFPTDSAEGEPAVGLNKAKFKATGWMLLELIPDEGGGGGLAYSTTMITETEPGVFDIADVNAFDAFSDELLIGGFLGFLTPDGAVGADVALQFKNKFDKEGALKSSKFSMLGALVTDSALLPPGFAEGIGLPYFANMTIKGKSVDETKLPFDPGEVLGKLMLKNLARSEFPRHGFAKSPVAVTTVDSPGN